MVAREVNCPFCNSDRFGEMVLEDRDLTIFKEADGSYSIEAGDTNENLCFSPVYCRDCLKWLDLRGKKIKEAKVLDRINSALEFVEPILDINLKDEEVINIIKKKLMLKELER